MEAYTVLNFGRKRDKIVGANKISHPFPIFYGLSSNFPQYITNALRYQLRYSGI